MIGQTISHYKIIEKLGEGGMGVVYKAQDLKLDRLVALKFLPPLLSASEQDKIRFIREAKTASALDHPNICTIYEVDEAPDGQLLLAMAYYEGRTLKEKIQAQRPGLDEAVIIAIELAQGLQAAHEKGIVHRDIKSANVMLTSKGQAKIMDFGLAKAAGRTQLTKAGATVGTIAYMSPEQALGEVVDHRSDIWSFGVVLYEMISGEIPFKSEYEQAVVYSILNEKPKPLTEFRSEVPAELEKIVSKCLSKQTADRYQDISELLANLHGLKGVAPPRDVTWKLVKKKYRKLVLPAIAVAAVITLAAAYVLLRENFDRQPTADGSASSIAVVYFENIPDPEDKDHLGEMLTNLLITSFSQTKGVQVVSRERLYDIQKELGLVESKTFTARNASNVAHRAGVKSMLVGSILQMQPTLLVTTRLIDVESGNILSSQRIAGYSADRFFTLVDSLSSLTLKDLNIGAPEARPVMAVTTNSPEAYRAYTEGVELRRKELSSEALAPLKKAVELDSNFAMAYFAIAQSQELFGDQAIRRTSLEKAWELRSRVTERERMLIEGAYARTIEKDTQKGAEILERLLQKYPREQEAYLELSHTYLDLNEYEKSEKTDFKGLKNDSLDKSLWEDLTYLYADLGRRKEALEAAHNYLRVAPGEYNPYDAMGDVYLIFGEADSALYWNRKMVTFAPRAKGKLGYDALLRQEYSKAKKYFEEGGTTFLLFLIPLHQGHLKEARDQLLRADPSKPGKMNSLTLLEYETGNYPSMLKYAGEVSAQLRKNPMNKVYGRDYLAWAYLKNGNKKMAYRLLDEIKIAASDGSATWQEQCQYEYTAALLAYEEKRYDAALEHFKKAFSQTFPNRFGQYFYGVTLVKTGHAAEAIDELQRSSWKYNIGWLPKGMLGFLPTRQYWLLASVKAHYWLGVAYEQKGDKEQAAAEFKKFLDIWNNADFDSPELKDARVRLANLTGMARK